MRREFIVFLLSVLVPVLSSCKDFLSERNPIGIENPYSSEALIEAGLEGIIAPAATNTAGYFGWFMQNHGYASGLISNSVAQDNAVRGEVMEGGRRLTVVGTANYTNAAFNDVFKVVNNANLFISKIPEFQVGDETYRREVEAEARFYRALFYFLGVRTFGDIPLRLTASTTQTASACPRSPYYKVYEQIVNDFSFAAENMRSPERASQMSPKYFRPNKFAAIAYLSSVYTHIGSLLSHPDDNFWDPSKEGRSPDFSALGIEGASAEQAYAKALEYAEKLIPESPNHDPQCTYRLVEKFTDLFNYDPAFSRNGYSSWKHPEQIMVVQSSLSSNISLTIPAATLPNYCEGTSATAAGLPYVRPNRWVVQKWSETYGGNKGKNTSANIYIDCKDPRYAGTLYYRIMQYNEEWQKQEGKTGTCNMYPAVNNITAGGAMSYFRKYWSRGWDRRHSDADFYLMRLAEVYLNAAEAAAYLGDEAAARDYIGVLHARARHSVADDQPDSDVPSWSERVFSSREELMTAIFWERVWELWGENHEYFDTHRFGSHWLVENIAKPMNAFNMLPEQEKLFDDKKPQMSYLYPTDFRYSEDPDVLRKSLISPYPSGDYLYNPAITNRFNDFDYGF